jgi:hypothetical protein
MELEEMGQKRKNTSSGNISHSTVWRIPEILLGSLLTVAVLAIGLVLGSSSSNSPQSSNKGSESIWQWIIHDAAGFFTFALVVVGIVQLCLFYWQLRLINKSLVPAEDAAKAAVTQADIAKDTLTKVQRPYVFVFGVDRLQTGNKVPAVTPFLKFSVANYGQTPAVIENVGAGFYAGEFPEAPLRVDDDHDLLVSPVLRPGEFRENLHAIIPEPFIAEGLGIIVNIEEGTTYPVPKIEPNEDLFFRVTVQYRGPFSDEHITSATWVYHKTFGHFVQYGHKDYNYTL